MIHSEMPGREARALGRLSGLCVFLALAAAAIGQLGHAAPPTKTPPHAQLIRLPLPITGNIDQQIKRAFESVLRKTRAGADRPVVVLEFWPAHSEFGEGSDFSRAHALARYLSSRDTARVKTVAFLPRSIKGHAVLVAMACEEIVMAPDALLGAAGLDEPAEEPIDPAVRSAYREIANRRRTLPPEVALGMLDKDLEILKVDTEISTEFVFRSELEKLRAKRAIRNEEVIIRAGEIGLFSGRQARQFNFVKYLAPDRRALARALGVPAAALAEDPSLWGSWRPVRVTLRGVITPQLTASVQKTINDQVEIEGSNFICLWIESPGGSLSDSVNLANYLASLDRGRLRTVAYVADDVRGDASLIAVACDEIVMHRDAALGGSGAQAILPDDVRLVRETLRESLAPKKMRSWSLWAALLDPSAKVSRYTHRTSGVVDYYCEAELAAQGDADQWVQGKRVTREGQPLQVRAAEAEELGLAQHVVGSFDEFKRLYGIADDIEMAEPGWASTLINALAAPGIAWLLLLVGGAAMYAELQSPGIGIGGFVAGICFLLYFWNRHLEGTAGWLEALLFAAGVSCIMLELFVVPGATIFGLGGGLLVLVSLVLASQTFVLPQNDYQLTQMRDSLLALAGAGLGVIVLAVLMQRFLPHTPFFGHVVLEPPSNEELASLSHREALVALDHLLGQRGVTTTWLMPSGKARFGDRVVDVSSQGEAISQDSPVVVVEVHGNHVVVRPA